MKKFILTLLLLINASSIYALTIGFSGTVTMVNDENGFIDGRINAGDTFTGSVTYDLSSYSLVEYGNISHYIFTAPSNMSVCINGLMFITNPSGGEVLIIVDNNSQEKSLSYISGGKNIFMGEDMPVSAMKWTIPEYDGTVPPGEAPVLSDDSNANFLIANPYLITIPGPGPELLQNSEGEPELYITPYKFTILGKVNFTEIVFTSNAPSTIPEPMTFILCFIGFGVLGRYARSRK